MTDAFIDLAQMDADTVREIVQQSGVAWPAGDDSESRLFRFNARRIVAEAHRRGVADGQKINAAVARMFEKWQQHGE